MKTLYTRPNYTPVDPQSLVNGLTKPQSQSLTAFPRVMGISDKDWFAHLGITLSQWHNIVVGGLCPKDIQDLPAKLAEVINLVKMLADEQGGTIEAHAWLSKSEGGNPSPVQRFITDPGYRRTLMNTLGGFPHEDMQVIMDEGSPKKEDKRDNDIRLFKIRLKVDPPGFRAKDWKYMLEDVSFDSKKHSSPAVTKLIKKLRQLDMMLNDAFDYRPNAIRWMQSPHRELRGMTPAAYFTMMNGSRDNLFDVLDMERGVQTLRVEAG